MANEESKEKVAGQAPQVEEEDDDDEPDEWDKRIFSTGCAEENTALNDCFREKLDWRACKEQMDLFKQCWKQRGNEQRTESKDAE